MLTSAREHYRRQQRITAAALIEARRRRGRGARAVAKAVAGFQLIAVRDALDSLAPMLDEQNIPDQPVAQAHDAALIGTASDGRPLDTLFEQATTPGMFDLMVATQLQDAARTAAGLGVAVRPNIPGYVRMLNPPSCSRCAILAGRFYKWNDGFARHPRCDCRHIPASESTATDLLTNPNGYFESLPTAADLNAKYPSLTVQARREAGLFSQEDIFTNAGARAIRDGADITQVVNVRRSMSTAQVGGRDVLVSKEGTTRFGQAFRAKTGRNMSARLMPETIYEVARDRDDALRLLKLHGYIT